MKTILLFGAGKSASVLISYLVAETEKNQWKLIVADASETLILSKLNGAASAEAVGLDINNEDLRGKLIMRAHVVISMMPPNLHFLIAKDCVEYRKHLLTASYLDNQLKSLRDEISQRKLFFLCEMGLDPGLDHMSAMLLINKIKAAGGEIVSFKSHCGGLVAPESDDNPWRYKISWNPRNIVLAGKAGATYRLDDEVINAPYETLFRSTALVDTDDDTIGPLSFYPNRDSLPYIELYKLQQVKTFVRTTLRYPDFMYGWNNIIELKLTDETPVFESDGKSLQDFFSWHLKQHGFGQWVDEKLSSNFAETKEMLDHLLKLAEVEAETEVSGEEIPTEFMIVDETGGLQDINLDEIKDNAATTVATKVRQANLTLKQLVFLGINDKDTLINKGFCSAADVLQLALETKLALKPEDKDMIVMIHEVAYIKDDVLKNTTSSLIVRGEDNVHTAMAKTVGLPLGIAATMLLKDEITLTGLHIPISEAIYKPVLSGLEKMGISFIEKEQ